MSAYSAHRAKSSLSNHSHNRAGSTIPVRTCGKTTSPTQVKTDCKLPASGVRPRRQPCHHKRNSCCHSSFKGARASDTFVALEKAGIENVASYVGLWNEWGDSSLPTDSEAIACTKPSLRRSLGSSRYGCVVGSSRCNGGPGRSRAVDVRAARLCETRLGSTGGNVRRTERWAQPQFYCQYPIGSAATNSRPVKMSR